MTEKLLMENWGRCFIPAPVNVREYMGEGCWLAESSVLSVMGYDPSESKTILAIIYRNNIRSRQERGPCRVSKVMDLGVPC